MYICMYIYIDDLLLVCCSADDLLGLGKFYSFLIIQGGSVFIYACVYVYMYIYMYIHIYIYVCICIYVHTCRYSCICIYLYTYTYTYICTCIYIVCIYVYTCMYVHMYVCSDYGEASISRLLKITGLFRISSVFIGLFCKRDL